jgi:hypothetical protein
MANPPPSSEDIDTLDARIEIASGDDVKSTGH